MTEVTPTAHELHAALAAARLIDPQGCSASSLDASYARAVTGGLYRTPDLRRGQLLLERAGLVTRDRNWCTPGDALVGLRTLPDDVAVEVLLQVVLTANPPLWLYAAVAGEVVRWENVPDGDAAALRQSIREAERREALLLSLGRTVDTQERMDLADAGEERVVAACRDHLMARGREDLARQVRRVSLYSDQLGYDVTSPDTTGCRHRLEVKTTASATEITSVINIYISRNEAQVGLGDASWALIAVRKDVVSAQLDIVGWCRAQAFSELLPQDASERGRWSSARIQLREDQLTPGLPLDYSTSADTSS